jgi:hypothetical protein
MNFCATQHQMLDWLQRYQWTHFVTLALNDPGVGLDRARNILKGWDARMNRRLFGPKWHKKPDERLFAFYFFEKPETNPHCSLPWVPVGSTAILRLIALRK